MIVLYAFWSVVYIPFAIYGYILNHRSFIYSIGAYIKGFIFTGTHFYSHHLWYVLSVIYYLIILMLIEKIAKKSIAKSILCVVSVVVYFVCRIASTFSFPYIDFIIDVLFNGNLRVLTGMFYISIGVVLYRIRKRLIMSHWLKIFLLLFSMVIYIITDGLVLKFLISVISALLFMRTLDLGNIYKSKYFV